MKVSVICPVFNTQPHLLAQAVKSVLDNGASHQIELILVNDYSTNPSTKAKLQDLASNVEHVQIINRSSNGGPARARADGLARASHDWIGFIDSDDLWPSAKLDIAQAALQERPDARWINGNYSTIGLNCEPKPSEHFTNVIASDASTSIRCRTPDLTRQLIGSWLPLGTSVLQKELLVEAGGFNSSLVYGEDWLLFVLLSLLTPMDYVKSQSYILRRQGASMMRSPGVMSYKMVKSGIVARRDARLRPFRRELRWWCYRTFKDIAMNNALNGKRWSGLFYAMQALMTDPRELNEFTFYIQSLFKEKAELADRLRLYSRAKQVDLAQIAQEDARLSVKVNAGDKAS